MIGEAVQSQLEPARIEIVFHGPLENRKRVEELEPVVREQTDHAWDRRSRERDEVLWSRLDPEEGREHVLEVVRRDPPHEPVDRPDRELLLGELDDESEREVVRARPVAVSHAAFRRIGAGGLVTVVAIRDQHRGARAERGDLGHAALVGHGPYLVDHPGSVGGPPAGFPGL